MKSVRRGWDIRAEAWLPSYPQLGGKIVFEQYYGDEVALFGTDNLEKDPYAVTLGLNYQPVPLLTVGTDYKAGTGDTFTWSGADKHCDILPGMRQFGALATVVPTTVQDLVGWPIQGNYYWSSLAGMANPA